MADFRTEYEKVYEAIRNAVIAGQYAPGERLPQRKLAETFDIQPSFFIPKNFTASQLPDIPTHFSYMCCPRSIGLTSIITLPY